MSEQDEQRDARPIDPDLTRRRPPEQDPPQVDAPGGLPVADSPQHETAGEQTDHGLQAGGEATAPPVQRLLPPSQAIHRSKIAEEFVTHTPGQPDQPDAPAAEAGRWPPAGAPPRSGPSDRTADHPRHGPVEATFDDAAHAHHAAGTPGPATAAQPAQAPAATGTPVLPAQAHGPESTGGLGDQPDEPIVTLPPLAEAIAGYPISERTGEPVRNWVVLASMLSFALAALVSTAAYWWYWWVAIHIESFHTSAWLISWFEPRPGSGSSVVLVCVLAVIGAIMTAGPGVAGYNVWHGASFSRIAGLVACGTSLLAIFVLPWAWFALLFSAIGAGLLWLPAARSFLSAWDAFANPPRPAIKPYQDVAYGPVPRYR